MLQPGTHRAPAGWRPRRPQLGVSSASNVLAVTWRHRWVGVAVTAVIAVGAAGILALLMPRGPITTAQALTAMVVALLVGVAGGFTLRSRWAMLLAPLAFVLVFELRWLSVDGPTVDGMRFDNAYGILAIILGRGFFGLVALLPMLLGVALGAALARRIRRESARPARMRGRVWLYTRRGVSALVALGLVALAVLIARPASTPAIVGPDGEPLPGSIASFEQVEIGGHQTSLLIRGRSVDNPVLLFLSGGPGQTDMPQIRAMWRDLERDFVIVNWDERGVGKSYAELDPTSTLTLDAAVADAIELTNYLRARFDEEKIYLVGESWGTILGVLAVQRQPQLFHAYIGSGQMVDVQETDRRLYRDMLAYADRTGDEGAAEKMRSFGPPPYDDPFANAYVMGYYDKLAGEYSIPEYTEDRYDQDPYGPWGVLGSEYTLVEKVNVLRSLIDYFSVMYPQIQDVDFRRDATRLEVPVYLVQGRHELDGRKALVPQWLRRLDAPSKRLYWFERSGHSAAMEEFRRFHQIMTGTVLPETYRNRADQ